MSCMEVMVVVVRVVVVVGVLGLVAYHRASSLSSSCSSRAPGRLVFLMRSSGGGSVWVLMEVVGRDSTEWQVDGRSWPLCSLAWAGSWGSGEIISPSSGEVGTSSMGCCVGEATSDLLEEERLDTSSEE